MAKIRAPQRHRNEAALEENRVICRHTVKTKREWTPYGIKKSDKVVPFNLYQAVGSSRMVKASKMISNRRGKVRKDD